MAKKSSFRRDFLNPLKAIQAFREEAAEVPQTAIAPAEDLQSSPSDHGLLFVSQKAMACTFQVYFLPHNVDAVSEIAIEALQLVDELEDQMTVYRSSPVTYLNETAVNEPVRVESRLFQLFLTGQSLYQKTGGAFDMTAGLLSKAWGFFRKQGRVPEKDELQEILNRVGTQHLQLDQQNETVQIKRDGVELNLGGIGKGFALDRAAEFMKEQGVDNFLIHGGQSSVLARGRRYPEIEKKSSPNNETDSVTNGTSQGPPNESANSEDPDDYWKVGVLHPTQLDKRVAEICLKDKALGTSGTGRQSFYHQGVRYGHIIDPRSGLPADGVYSSTAIAPTAAEADALATAFYVMGPDKAVEFCQQHKQYSCLILSPGKKQDIEIRQHGFLPGELKLL